MSETRFPDQWVLFEVATDGELTLWYFHGKQIEADACEFGLEQFIEVPTAPGVYVWEGDWWYWPGGWAGADPVDAESGWGGEVREATPADLLRAVREACEDLACLRAVTLTCGPCSAALCGEEEVPRETS